MLRPLLLLSVALASASAELLFPSHIASSMERGKAFEVLWNSPFEGCQNCKPDPQLTSETTAKFSITANKNMAFVGKEIALNYALTAGFPSLHGVYIHGSVPCWSPGADPATCTLTPFANVSVAKNGGVPQAADVQAVAATAAAALVGDSRIPANFSGLLVLDMESWRPVSADNDALYVNCNTNAIFFSLFPIEIAERMWNFPW